VLTLSLSYSVLYALAYAKNALWAGPCLSVCRVFNHIFTELAMVCIVTMTLDHIVATVTLNTVALDTTVAFVIPLVDLLTSSPVIWRKEYI
jgi:hypothetical protein